VSGVAFLQIGDKRAVKGRRRLVLFVGILLPAAICADGQVTGFRDPRRPLQGAMFFLGEKSLCGPISLYLAWRSYGIRRYTVGDVAEMARSAMDGTSMEGLEEACKQVGLWAQSVKMDVAALRRLMNGQSHVRAVLLLDNGHFVYVGRCNDSLFRVTRYPFKPEWRTASELNEAWCGYALLVSSEPLPASAFAVRSALSNILWAAACSGLAIGSLLVLRRFWSVMRRRRTGGFCGEL